MKKSGFTLVELLAVIGILSIVIVIAIGSAMGIKNNSLQNILESKISSFEADAILYGQENPNLLKETCNVGGYSYEYCKLVTVGELLDQNFAESNEGSVIVDGTERKDVYNNVTNNSMRCDTIQIYRKNNRVYAKTINIFSNDENNVCEN